MPLDVSFLSIHNVSEILIIIQRIDLGRTVIQFIDEYDLIFPQTFHVDQIRIMRQSITKFIS